MNKYIVVKMYRNMFSDREYLEACEHKLDFESRKLVDLFRKDGIKIYVASCEPMAYMVSTPFAEVESNFRLTKQQKNDLIEQIKEFFLNGEGYETIDEPNSGFFYDEVNTLTMVEFKIVDAEFIEVSKKGNYNLSKD